MSRKLKAALVTLASLLCAALWAGAAILLVSTPQLAGGEAVPAESREGIAVLPGDGASEPESGWAEGAAWQRSEYGDNDYLEASGQGFSAQSATSVGAALAHEHIWEETTQTVEHPARTHTERVVVPGNAIIEEHTICDACKQQIDGQIEEHYLAHQDHIEAGYITGYPVEMGREPDTYETKEVVDEEAWTETLVTRRCTVCGFEEVASDGR